ncbi:MAG: hypothetical protein MI892_01530, partial [Desulfobacterales bacterium]|nr:hypothetical protein [Desulfobacterales bacterium]
SVNVKVHGRGILCGVKQEFHYDGLPQLCELEPWNYRTNIHRGGHTTVEGITLLNSFNHNLAVGTHSLVKDVKFIAWKVNNDGIRSGDFSVVDHCFMKVSDDHLYAFSDTLIRRCLFWPMWNGAILQLGWGSYGGSGTRFVNNDIINPEWNQWWYNNGVIASQVHPNSQNSDILIQDLRIEGDINALANLHFNSGSRGTGPWSGFIKDITFRNVTVEGRQLWMNGQEGWYETIPDDIQFEVIPEAPVRQGRSLIKGHQDKAGNKAFIHHVVFENVKVNGEVLTEANHDRYVDVDDATTHDIRFIETQNYDSHLSVRPGQKRSDDYTKENLGAGSYPTSVEKPWRASNAGWLAADTACSWTVDLPKEGLYDLKISIACG